MFRTITVAIPDEAAAALKEIADREFRRPKDQAGLLLVEAIRTASRRQRQKPRDGREATR